MPSSPLLFTPFRLGRRLVRNRIWASPMCMYAVEARDGIATDWHLVHLGGLAKGGAGLVIAEATAVLPEGRISAWDLGLWSDGQIAPLRRIAEFIGSQGAMPGIQLAHAGRKASTHRSWSPQRGTLTPDEGGWQSVAPSALAFPGLAEPRALDGAEVAAIPAAFAAAARRAVAAGFEVLEVHAAHGYLLHQFLSPLSNLRDDEWGGDLEGRARLLRQTVRAVAEAAGDQAEVIVRFSATDWVEGGWDPAQTATAAEWAAEDGAVLIDVSSGGIAAGARIPVGPGYQAPLAAEVRARTGLPTTAVGLITSAAQAESLLAAGAADAVFIGRELLRDPHLPNRWSAELGAGEAAVPPSYHRAPFPAPAALR